MRQNPQTYVKHTVEWIKTICIQNNKKSAVIAVSGGIDSAVALTLTTRALGAENVTTLFLPYKDQSYTDAQHIAEWNGIPAPNQRIYNIETTAHAVASLTHADKDQYRMGNILARSRMLFVYDTAKELNALVCGTENRSEHYLGYFTRFGDAASDFEPLSPLYKSDVRSVAQYLKLPAVFIEKAPSAGLWQGQTDEIELGFTYEHADAVCRADFDGDFSGLATVPEPIIKAVRERIASQVFKHHVPYVQ